MATVELIEHEISHLYGLLDHYKIYIQPTDLAMFQTLGPTLRNLKEAVDSALDSKEENISKFSNEQDKTLQDLMVEVGEIRNKTQDPMVLNPASSSEFVLAYLDDLCAQLDNAEVLKSRYEGWGELFKNGGTVLKFSNESPDEKLVSAPKDTSRDTDLDETKKEIDLKRKLWLSLRDWDSLTTYILY